MIQYVTLFYRLLLQMLYGRRILENDKYRKESLDHLTVVVKSNSDLHIFVASFNGEIRCIRSYTRRRT